MKKAFVLVLACTLILSLASCGGAPAAPQSTPQSEPPSSQQSSGDPAGVPDASSQIGTAPSQGAPALPQGEPEVVDLNRMAELYSQDATVQDRLGGRNVEVTGYLKLDRDKDKLYLWGASYDHKEKFGDNPMEIELMLYLSPETEALLRGEEFFLAWITLTGQIREGMEEVRPETSSTLRYTMGGVSYVTNVHEVTGIVNKDQDGDYRMEGLGCIRFLNKADAPADGTEVTLSGKLSYGGDFREAVVVK